MTSPKRTCLLTGASGTLGTAFCRSYASRYDIVAVYHRHEPAFPSQLMAYVDPLRPDAQLPANTHRTWAVQADLGQPDEVRRVVEVALARLGAIDLVVNAAASSTWAGFLDGTTVLDSWSSQSAVNVLAPLWITHELATRSWHRDDEANRQRRRNVVSVTSTAGVFAYLGQGQSVYAATKAALNHLTVHLADELSPIGVRVNAVAPNAFPAIVPTNRVAAAVVELDEGLRSGEIMVLEDDHAYLLDSDDAIA